MSSFQAVKQANGNSVIMLATFTEVGGVSLTQNQKQVSKCKLIDDNGESHTVRLYGTMPTPALINMRQQFSLSSYQGTLQSGQPYTGFSGFWNDRAMVNQAPTAPPQPQQGTQQPAQRPNVPQQPQAQGIQPQSNGRDTSIERQCAFKAACNRAKETDMKPNDIIELARQGQYFIETGSNINDVSDYEPNPDYVGDNPPPPDDSEIPF